MRVFPLFSLIACFTTSIAQNSIELMDKNTNTLLAPNALIQLSTQANAVENYTIDVKNTSASTKKYWVKRYDLSLNSGANAYFCFASYCYGPDVTYTPNAITLTAGQSSSQLAGSFQMLVIDLSEAPSVGYSYIKYTVFDSINPVDSVQFSVKYNIALGLRESIFSPDEVLNVYPNPIEQNNSLYLNSTYKGAITLKLFNASGQLLREEEIDVEHGTTALPFSIVDLSPGLYYIRLENVNAGQTQKLLVH
jgi:hypothetical protein